MWEKLAFCMPKYAEFTDSVNRKDIKRPHIFMNQNAQAKLGEFYLCCAFKLWPEKIDAAGEDSARLLEVANSVANEEVEPYFERCREFISGYDEELHKRLDGTTIWREVEDGLFWHHSFEAAAPELYAKYQATVLPPKAEWPKHGDTTDVEGVMAAVTRAVAEDGSARANAEAVYQAFLEASVTPVQGSIRTALIDHGIIWGKVRHRDGSSPVDAGAMFGQ